jgi:hypothetical protein
MLLFAVEMPLFEIRERFCARASSWALPAKGDENKVGLWNKFCSN